MKKQRKTEWNGRRHERKKAKNIKEERNTGREGYMKEKRPKEKLE